MKKLKQTYEKYRETYGVERSIALTAVRLGLTRRKVCQELGFGRKYWAGEILADDLPTLRIVAALLAVSNIGCAMPDPYHIRALRQNAPSSLDIPVRSFARPYIETDRDEQAFIDEARSWIELLCHHSIKDVAREYMTIKRVWWLSTPGKGWVRK